jgi:hypothetical protein
MKLLAVSRRQTVERSKKAKPPEFCPRVITFRACSAGAGADRDGQYRGVLHVTCGTPARDANRSALLRNDLARRAKKALLQNIKNPPIRAVLHFDTFADLGKTPRGELCAPTLFPADLLTPRHSQLAPAQLSANAASNATPLGSKSSFFTNSHASRAPCSRSMPMSSHSTDSGPSYFA